MIRDLRASNVEGFNLAMCLQNRGISKSLWITFPTEGSCPVISFFNIVLDITSYILNALSSKIRHIQACNKYSKSTILTKIWQHNGQTESYPKIAKHRNSTNNQQPTIFISYHHIKYQQSFNYKPINKQSCQTTCIRASYIHILKGIYGFLCTL